MKFILLMCLLIDANYKFLNAAESLTSAQEVGPTIKTSVNDKVKVLAQSTSNVINSQSKPSYWGDDSHWLNPRIEGWGWKPFKLANGDICEIDRGVNNGSENPIPTRCTNSSRRFGKSYCTECLLCQRITRNCHTRIKTDGLSNPVFMRYERSLYAPVQRNGHICENNQIYRHCHELI